MSLVDTGDATMNGGRIRRIAEYVRDEDAFCLTYGDGVSDIDLGHLIKFHRAHGLLATITATNPLGRFGTLNIRGDDRVTSFHEKPKGDGGMINGGFFVLSPKVIDLIDGDQTLWEREPLERLAEAGELVAYRHDGFWRCMDTLRDKQLLEDLWASGNAPWKAWS